MNRRMAHPAVVLFFAVFLSLQLACSKLGRTGEPPAEEAAALADASAARVAAPSAPQAPSSLGYVGRGGGEAPPAAPAPVPRKLIRTVVLELRAGDTQATAEDMQRLVEELGGFVGSMTARRQGEVFHYSLVLRVPVDELDDAVARIKEMAVELDRETIQAEDVTDRFVDLEARLRTLRATETELQGLLAESREREYDAENIMAVYRQLTEIRTQIEQIQGQLQVLENMSALATIHVELHPTEAARPVVEERWRPGDTARRSVRGLLEALQFLADLVIVVVIAVLPVVLLVVLPIALVVWWLVHRARKRRREAGSA